MRTLSMRGALAVLIVVLAACGSSGASPDAQALLQQKADSWDIDQIEKNFHEATTLKDIDLMMSLWAPNATLSIGPELTASGRDEIRRMWLEEGTAFKPNTHLISDQPAYKVQITVSGDRGTLHFECHYVDAATGEIVLVTEADLDVARIDGRWLITNMVGGTTELTP
ncbi:MAG: nuclear transport factor 2 family protein [Actinobacteria bacterium]|nr:nuclear transport factor 2 family protein [Actinomycetota bacterium]